MPLENPERELQLEAQAAILQEKKLYQQAYGRADDRDWHITNAFPPVWVLRTGKKQPESGWYIGGVNKNDEILVLQYAGGKSIGHKICPASVLAHIPGNENVRLPVYPRKVATEPVRREIKKVLRGRVEEQPEPSMPEQPLMSEEELREHAMKNVERIASLLLARFPESQTIGELSPTAAQEQRALEDILKPEIDALKTEMVQRLRSRPHPTEADAQELMRAVMSCTITRGLTIASIFNGLRRRELAKKDLKGAFREISPDLTQLPSEADIGALADKWAEKHADQIAQELFIVDPQHDELLQARMLALCEEAAESFVKAMEIRLKINALPAGTTCSKQATLAMGNAAASFMAAVLTRSYQLYHRKRTEEISDMLGFFRSLGDQ